MYRNDFPVSTDSRRGGDKKCFYCSADVGNQHLNGCVQRDRTVIVEFTIQLLVEQTEHHDADLIEFGYNEASWCANNFEQTLSQAIKNLESADRCLCDHFEARFVREATEEDEAKCGYPGWKQS